MTNIETLWLFQSLRRRFLMTFFYLFLCKNWNSYLHCGSTTKDHDLHKIEYTLPENAYTQASAFLAEFFRRRFSSIYYYVKIEHHHCAPPPSPGFLIIKPSKSFLYLFLWKKFKPLLWPFLTARNHNLKKLYWHFLVLLSHNFQPFWCNGLWKKDFKRFSHF